MLVGRCTSRRESLAGPSAETYERRPRATKALRTSTEAVHSVGREASRPAQVSVRLFEFGDVPVGWAQVWLEDENNIFQYQAFLSF
jgi:hypothetical protein